MTKVWLWKNFVDGRPEYWAFDNPYPCYTPNGDPMTLGEPCGYAIIKESKLSANHQNWSEPEILEAIVRAQEGQHGETAEEIAWTLIDFLAATLQKLDDRTWAHLLAYAPKTPTN